MVPTDLRGLGIRVSTIALLADVRVVISMPSRLVPRRVRVVARESLDNGVSANVSCLEDDAHDEWEGKFLSSVV